MKAESRGRRQFCGESSWRRWMAIGASAFASPPEPIRNLIRSQLIISHISANCNTEEEEGEDDGGGRRDREKWGSKAPYQALEQPRVLLPHGRECPNLPEIHPHPEDLCLPQKSLSMLLAGSLHRAAIAVSLEVRRRWLNVVHQKRRNRVGQLLGLEMPEPPLLPSQDKTNAAIQACKPGTPTTLLPHPETLPGPKQVSGERRLATNQQVSQSPGFDGSGRRLDKEQKHRWWQLDR